MLVRRWGIDPECAVLIEHYDPVSYRGLPCEPIFDLLTFRWSDGYAAEPLWTRLVGPDLAAFRLPDAVISVNTKSATNQFRGFVFEYLRDNYVTGAPFPNNTILANRIDGTVAKLIALFPHPMSWAASHRTRTTTRALRC